MGTTLSLIALLSPISAAALEPSLDFKITDEPSYQSFRDAVGKAEQVRNAFVQDPKPRVIGGVAGLLHYATVNPLASDTQLSAFLAEYNARLAAHAPGDEHLYRGSHIVSAVRFELPVAGLVALEGTNTNLGQEIAESLGIDVPPAYEFQENERRIVRFEQARLRALPESAAWANLLTIGFSGQDLLGHPNPDLPGVLQTYLEGEGYSPFAPTCGGCVDIVGDALALALPASFAEYEALLADPFSTDGIWDDAVVGFEAVNQESSDRIDELADIMIDEPSLIQAAANANNDAFVAQKNAEYLANLARVADERAIINVNAMLLAQAPDASTRELGDKAQRLASIQLSQNKGWAAAGLGVQVLGGAASTAFEFAKGSKKDPVTIAKRSADAVTAALGLGSLLGGEDDQLLDQMVAIRQQIVKVQFQLNGR
ncbi:MAG: hypothetical protein KJN97_04670, partial [Deltaproteobacteria bacterium]|nr:hypothetical protein [Deltaproteobacteria bacterium]